MKATIHLPKFDQEFQNKFLDEVGKMSVVEFQKAITLYNLGRKNDGKTSYDVEYSIVAGKLLLSITTQTEDTSTPDPARQSVSMLIDGKLYFRPANPLGVQTGITLGMYLELAKKAIAKRIPQILKQTLKA